MIVPAIVYYRLFAFGPKAVELILPETLLNSAVLGPPNENLFVVDSTTGITLVQKRYVETLPRILGLLFETVYRRTVNQEEYQQGKLTSHNEYYTDYGSYYMYVMSLL